MDTISQGVRAPQELSITQLLKMVIVLGLCGAAAAGALAPPLMADISLMILSLL